MISSTENSLARLRNIIAAILLTVILYGASFIIRTELSILSYSAFLDWIIALSFAAFPCILIKGLGASKVFFLYVVTVLLEVAATVLIILTWYPAIL
jgi:hypothetical protein